MRRRGILVTLILLLTAIIVEVPLILLTFVFSVQYYRSGRTELSFLGFNSYSSDPILPYAFNGAKLVQDRIYRANGRSIQPSFKTGRLEVSSVAFDQDADLDDSGTTVESNELNYDPGWSQTVFGDADNLWLLGGARQNIDGGWVRDIVKVEGDKFIPQAAMPHAQQSPMALRQPTVKGHSYEYVLSEAFVFDGKLSSIYSPYSPLVGHLELIQLIDGKWESQGVVELLDVTRAWKNSANDRILEPVSPPPPGWGTAKGGLLEVLPVGTTAHLFWRLPGRLLYRRGFKFEETDVLARESKQGSNVSVSDTPASAEQTANSTGVTDDWLLVSDRIPDGALWFPGTAGGEPVVVVVEDEGTGYPVAMALRLEQGRWNEYSMLELPFSSSVTNLGSRDDGSASYFAATTPIRRGGVFEVGSTGIRPTEIQYALRPHGNKGYIVLGVFLVWSVIAALILALIATICMCRDQARYEFGHQSVELASVMERTVARAIDGILILLLPCGVASLLAKFWAFDWKTTVEASEIRVFDHPSFTLAFRIAAITFGSLLVLFLLYVAVQGRFSVTPGKWICRLRVVQTSLRPCGFAKSLLREVLLFVDNLYLISWTPGILMIAFTPLRQRLGDRFADTIVVRARSLH